MTHDDTWERILIGRRVRMRKALGDRTLVTPLQAYVALGFAAEGYDARSAEAVCGTLAGLGFKPYGDAWVRSPAGLIDGT